MQRKQLLASIAESLPSRLPEGLRDFETAQVGRLLKVYYGDPAFHFEVWFHESKGLVEVAYHGEGTASANRRLEQRLAEHLIEIKEQLGPTVELEPWVRSWVRLYQMFPTNSPEPQLKGRLAERLARMIALIQPLVWDLAPAGLA